MKTILATLAMMTFCHLTYASPLNGHFDITATIYGGGGVYSYCLALESHGPEGVYRDQGAAYVLTTPAKKYAYAGQYRLFNHQLSVVVSNLDLEHSGLFFKAHLNNAQFTDTTFDQGFGSGQSGTFTAVRRGEGCKQD